jgi:mRNA interferase MazF
MNAGIASFALLQVAVARDAGDGLKSQSPIMIDKAMTILRTKDGEAIGPLEGDAMVDFERRLAVFLRIAK